MLKLAFYSVQRPQYAKNRLRRLDCCCDRGWQLEYGNGVKKDTLSSAMNNFLNSCITYSRSRSVHARPYPKPKFGVVQIVIPDLEPLKTAFLEIRASDRAFGPKSL